MKKTLLAAALVGASMGCSSDQNNPDSPESLLAFIPKDYTILDTTRGDLNQDGITDLIMVVNKVGEDSLSTDDEILRRKTLLLLGQKDKTYKQVKANDNSVYCYHCGGVMGDPYQETKITKDGKFVINHFGGSNFRWARTSTFQYDKDKNDWFLTEDAFVSLHTSNPDEAETKILTPNEFGEVNFENFNLYEDQ